MNPSALQYPEGILSSASYTNVLLIDSLVKEYQTFYSSSNSLTFPIVYSRASSKSDLLSVLRLRFTTIDRIGIAFCANEWVLDMAPFYEGANSPNLAFVINLIKEFNVKHIDFLASSTLNSPDWTNYYTILENETGVIIGASNDQTGNLKYGGDWITEITSEDVEMIYFTNSIAYHTYLLYSSNAFIWATIGINYTYVLAHDGFLYVSYVGSYPLRIGKISLTDPTLYNPNWAEIVIELEVVTGNAGGLAIHNGYIYLSSKGYISKISLTDPGGDHEYKWAITRGNTEIDYWNDDIIIYDGYLYNSNWNNGVTSDIIGSIGRINLSNPHGDNNQFWAIGLLHSAYCGMAISDGYLYVTSFDTDTIDKISLAHPENDFAKPWTTTGNGPQALSIINGYLYVSNRYENTIGKISLTDPISNNDKNWKMDVGSNNDLWSCYYYSGSFYLTQYYSNDIIKFFLITPHVLPVLPVLPAATICFPGFTPIQTDQGIFRIDQLIPDKHTIHNKQIVDITKTVTLDKHLVCFQPHALGRNYPAHATVMSKRHSVYYRGKMVEAIHFIGRSNRVFLFPYQGEPLYNVLLHDHGTMRVNNLICETLHPNNIIAKLYTRKCKYSDKERDNILVLLYQCLKKNDLATYNTIVDWC